LNGFVVVCDRFFFDWFYNLWGNASIALVRLLPKPSIAFLLDVPVTVAFSRMHYPLDKQVRLSYYESLREWYLMLARRQNFFIIDSSSKFEEVKDTIKKYVISMLGSNG
jgi:thymidylate kinase